MTSLSVGVKTIFFLYFIQDCFVPGDRTVRVHI